VGHPVAGTQKTGTTWMFRALTKHPSFIPAIRRPGQVSSFSRGPDFSLIDIHVYFTLSCVRSHACQQLWQQSLRNNPLFCLYQRDVGELACSSSVSSKTSPHALECSTVCSCMCHPLFLDSVFASLLCANVVVEPQVIHCINSGRKS
jgi:hypothetical protein